MFWPVLSNVRYGRPICYSCPPLYLPVTSYTLNPSGSVVVHEGAHTHLSKRVAGGHLLPVGVLGSLHPVRLCKSLFVIRNGIDRMQAVIITIHSRSRYYCSYARL